MKIISVAGVRQNSMKIAPLIRAIEKHNQKENGNIEHIFVQAGQQEDEKMSFNFFKALDIPAADIYMDIKYENHAEQIAKTIREFNKVL